MKNSRIKPHCRPQTLRKQWTQGVLLVRLRTASSRKKMKSDASQNDAIQFKTLSPKFIFIFNLFCKISVLIFIISIFFSFYMVFNITIAFIFILIFSFPIYMTINNLELNVYYLYIDKSDIALLLAMPTIMLVSAISVLYLGFTLQ